MTIMDTDQSPDSILFSVMTIIDIVLFKVTGVYFFFGEAACYSIMTIIGTYWTSLVWFSTRRDVHSAAITIRRKNILCT